MVGLLLSLPRDPGDSLAGVGGGGGGWTDVTDRIPSRRILAWIKGIHGKPNGDEVVEEVMME